MNIIEHELMQKCLKSTNDSQIADRKSFNEWKRGKISTKKCMELFFENNKVSAARQLVIDEKLFEDFLHSLGW